MAAAFCASLAVTVAVLGVAGAGERGTSIALQLTGRLSFLLFWPAYAGAAAAVLFAPRFAFLARHGRDFGLAYAAAQLVHIGLVAHIISLSKGPFTAGSLMPFFAVGVVWTYLLAASSVKRVARLFNPSVLQALRNIGLEYLMVVFFVDLMQTPIFENVKHPLEYWPFAILLVAGVVLRVAALAQRWSGLRPPWRSATLPQPR